MKGGGGSLTGDKEKEQHNEQPHTVLLIQHTKHHTQREKSQSVSIYIHTYSSQSVSQYIHIAVSQSGGTYIYFSQSVYIYISVSQSVSIYIYQAQKFKDGTPLI